MKVEPDRKRTPAPPSRKALSLARMILRIGVVFRALAGTPMSISHPDAPNKAPTRMSRAPASTMLGELWGHQLRLAHSKLTTIRTAKMPTRIWRLSIASSRRSAAVFARNWLRSLGQRWVNGRSEKYRTRKALTEKGQAAQTAGPSRDDTCILARARSRAVGRTEITDRGVPQCNRAIFAVTQSEPRHVLRCPHNTRRLLINTRRVL